MLIPYQCVKASLPHETIAIVADPHEISNVSGLEELAFMLSSSKNYTLSIYYIFYVTKLCAIYKIRRIAY